MKVPYFYQYKDYIRESVFPFKEARKVTVDAGFSCPNIDGGKGHGGCIFCNNEAFSPVSNKFARDSITQQLADQIPFLKKRYRAKNFIAYFQPHTNTYAPIELLKEAYHEAINHPQVVGLAIGTRPDCISKEVVTLLCEIVTKVPVSLEIGLQTINDETLKQVNRCHTLGDFEVSMHLLKGSQLEIGIHLMLGLPGEDHTHWMSSIRKVTEYPFHTLKITPLYVAKDTVLTQRYYKGEYQPLTEEQYIHGVVDMLEHVPKHIGIQRITGSAPRNILIAPMWCRDQARITQLIAAEFEKRGSYQGIKCFKVSRTKGGRVSLGNCKF